MKIFKASKTPRKRKTTTKGRQSKLGEKKRQKKPSEKLPRTIKSSKSQVGRSDKLRDKTRVAMKPGKRKSKSGVIYYEKRKNRSDLTGGV